VREKRRSLRRQADRELLEKLERQAALIEQLKAPSDKQIKRERRHAIRHECKVSIQMLIGTSAGFSNDWAVDSIEIKGRLLDLSMGGASLLTKQSFETGQRLRLTVFLGGSAKISANAAVRWVKAIPEKGAHASGLEFTGLADKDRKTLTKFFKRLDAAQDK